MGELGEEVDFCQVGQTKPRESGFTSQLVAGLRTDGGEASSHYIGHLKRGVPASASSRASGAQISPGRNPNSRVMHDLDGDSGLSAVSKGVVWIDLDNTPHVPFFKPIIRELKKRGYEVFVTARDAFQVCDLARLEGLDVVKVGRHYGRNRFMKVWGLVIRGMQLMPLAIRRRPAIGLSHGARSQVFVCNLLGIPSVLVMDYEFSTSPPMARPAWEIVPDALPNDGLHCRDHTHIRKYRGIKEDVYAGDFRPDPSILDELCLRDSSIIATVRPPATEAHYHNPESDMLFETFMQHAFDKTELKMVLLPRNGRQADEIRKRWNRFFASGRVVVPTTAVNGLNLVWHSDFVVSGGGTMNREAAALGVPVYSIFRGRIGAVDQKLADEARLTLITSVDEVKSRILLVPRERKPERVVFNRNAIDDILTHVEEILRVTHA